MHTNLNPTLRIAVLAAAIAAALPAAAQQSAAEGNWLVRVRAVNVDTYNGSTPIGALGVPKDAIHVEDKVIPEVDISYFFDGLTAPRPGMAEDEAAPFTHDFPATRQTIEISRLAPQLSVRQQKLILDMMREMAAAPGGDRD